MPAPKPFHFETDVNGALSLACQRAQAYADAARARLDAQVYARALRRWQAWCAEMHTAPLPRRTESIAAYLAELARAGKSVASVRAALAAIQYYASRGRAQVAARGTALAAVLAGIVRDAPAGRSNAPALELERLRAIIAGITGEDLRALRDRALLLLGFFGALRRSELVALDASGAGRSFAEIRPEGLVLHLTATKASAATQSIYLPRRGDALCAASALERYLAAAGLAHGPLFRPVSKAVGCLSAGLMRQACATSCTSASATTGSRRTRCARASSPVPPGAASPST